MDWKTPLFKIYWDESDIAAVNNVIKRGMSWAIGPEVAALEDKLAGYLGARYCLCFNSGTSALHAVLLAHGIGPGDEVIVPSFTFIATANAALFVGAKPVFADIEEQTLGLDPADVERKITPRTKAILPIHYGGCPCLVEELKAVARKHNLLLIEDAAEALGAEVNGAKIGSIGDSAILSFCQNKIITTGEGGGVVTNSQDIYEKMKLVRSHGRRDVANYFDTTDEMDYVTLGYNSRLSSMSAALGLAQLGKVNKLLEMRRENARLYARRLSGAPGITLPIPPAGSSHVYQMYTIRVLGHLRNGLLKHLAGDGVMSKVFFHPVHKTVFYKSALGYDCSLPVTEKVSSEVLTLPMYAGLTEQEIDTIAGRVSEYLAEAR